MQITTAARPVITHTQAFTRPLRGIHRRALQPIQPSVRPVHERNQINHTLSNSRLPTLRCHAHYLPQSNDPTASGYLAHIKPIVLAGHGAYDRRHGLTTIPAGCYLSMYTPHGGMMDLTMVCAIIKNQVPNFLYHRLYGPGERVPNYELQPLDGIRVPGKPKTVEEPTLLSDLLHPNQHFQWAACTADDDSIYRNHLATSQGIRIAHYGPAPKKRTFIDPAEIKEFGFCYLKPPNRAC